MGVILALPIKFNLLLLWQAELRENDRLDAESGSLLRLDDLNPKPIFTHELPHKQYDGSYSSVMCIHQEQRPM